MSWLFELFIKVLPAKMYQITKSVQKHTDNKFFAAFEPQIPTHLYKEFLGI